MINNEEIVLEEDIEKHNELNSKLFDNENNLKENIKERILKIVKFFMQEAKEENIIFSVRDVLLIGSNCSYNYTKDSDLDVHIIIREDKKNPNLQKELDLLRKIFNTNYNISVKKIPIELYVELDKTNANSKGIYSLKKGWIKFPNKEEIPELSKEKEEEFNKMFKKYEKEYLELIK